MARAFLYLLLLGGVALAQDDGSGCGEDDDSGIIIDGGRAEGEIDIEVDPFDVAPEPDEPNRPAPVEVGTWQPPELDAAAQRELDALLRRRAEAPGDVALRYQLAEFYLAHRWFPHAEAEFLACSSLDPDSIRPWEGVLRVYAIVPEDNQARIVRIVIAGGGVITEEIGEGEQDWLTPKERSARTTRAWREIVKRRPDDVARRRGLLAHLKSVRDLRGIEAESREILARLPGDAGTRFDLAEAVRRQGAIEETKRPGANKEALARARDLLEENLQHAPGHAPSLLRLARILAVLEGTAAEGRIVELEERGFFHMFVRSGLMEVDYRPDTIRMARDLSGPRLAGRLWDAALAPPRPDEFAIVFGDAQWPTYIQRWIYLHFPNPQPRDQIHVLERLARRGDRDSAGILLSFLWHLDPPEWYEGQPPQELWAAQRVEAAAVEAAARVGPASFAGAQRFLAAAEQPHHRRRAVALLRKLKDPRAVGALATALAWDTDEEVPYGVAAALEELGDPGAVAALSEAALDVGRPLARRREAAEALAAFKDPRAIEAMSRLAREPGFELYTAYGLLRLTGDEGALERLRAALRGEYDPVDVMRLLRKCDDPRIEGVLLDGLDRGAPTARSDVLALLRERYWPTARDRVRDWALKAAATGNVSEEVIDLLGELGGEQAAERLLAIVEAAQGVQWAKAARALAQTGDARGVRYFSRTRIVDPDPGRRRLAEEMYDVAAARRAELERAAAERSGE